MMNINMIKKIKLKKVLVVDDDDATNFLTELYFEDANLNVELIFKTTAEDALEYLKENIEECPELFFLDINLPLMSGWEFLDEFCKNNICKKVVAKIFMLSTSIFDKDKEKAKTYPCISDYIEKPLTVEKILEITQKYFYL